MEAVVFLESCSSGAEEEQKSQIRMLLLSVTGITKGKKKTLVLKVSKKALQANNTATQLF